jgi:uncharacterized alkaline shock family protein YloU
MKDMNFGQRMVSFIAGFVILIVMLVFFLILINEVDLATKYAEIGHLGFWWKFGCTAGLFLLSFTLIFGIALYRQPEEKVIVDKTPRGEVRIAVSAVENLVMRAVQKIKGVREAQARVSADVATGMNILIAVTALPDISIPQLLEEIRAKVEEYVTETTGIRPSSVKADVKRIAVDARSRVE